MSATTARISGTSFTSKNIDVTITLGTGSFGQTGKNTVKLSGLRVLASIAKGGFPSMDRASIQIYGVQPSVMNAISTLGVPLAMVRQNNTVLVEAGDTVNGMSVVYGGHILNAWQDFSAAPDTLLNIIGNTGQYEAIAPTPAISFPGQADVATIMSGIATRAGWAFENSGVTVKLPPTYLEGTALDQAQNVARHANINMYLDSGTATNTLAIWPKTGTRGGQIPLISDFSGLIGYPTFQSGGMSFRCLYNPNIRVGGQIKMQSSVGGAGVVSGATPPDANLTGGPNGFWMVGIPGGAPLSYDLSSQVEGGPWFCDVSCSRVNVGSSS